MSQTGEVKDTASHTMLNDSTYIEPLFPKEWVSENTVSSFGCEDQRPSSVRKVCETITVKVVVMGNPQHPHGEAST